MLMGTDPALVALLTLADQRFPSGGHIHSGGAEQAVSEGLVRDAATLEAFLCRRLLAAGRVTAGIAAAATCLVAADVGLLELEVDARMASPVQREASRAQGRGLLRTVRTAWGAPHPGLAWTDLGARPHHPVVLGCAARAAGASALGAATVAAYLAVTGPASAAQRLLALDPSAVAAVTVALSDRITAVARAAATEVAGATGWDRLPDDGDVLADLMAQRHAARDLTLFSS
jgi:urease accessory protein